MVHYYSRFIEVVKLTATRSQDVIVLFKSIFSRYGVPEFLVSDNDPQYSSQELKNFAAAYGFIHTARHLFKAMVRQSVMCRQ